MELMHMPGRAPRAAAALFGLAMIALVGCDEPANNYVAPPPPSVTVATPERRDITNYLTFTGTMQASKSVDVQPQVQGVLESIHFDDATDIKKGALLYKIDPRPYQAKVNQAKADVAQKRAKLTGAQANFKRFSWLYKRKATPRVDLDKARADRDIAQADVAAARAALETAALNLSFTEIRAPISGRIGRNLIDAGNLIGAGGNTKLVTIIQYDPIWAYFSLNERELLRLIKQRNGQADTAAKENPKQRGKIFLGLADTQGFPYEGQLDFVDQGVDPQTGTFLLRGAFPNPKPHGILPGMFARIRAPLEIKPGALLVPESALGADQIGRFLLVVNSENIVERRGVTLGAAIGQKRVIESGIGADELVVVTGLLRARPGRPVTPKRQLPARP